MRAVLLPTLMMFLLTSCGDDLVNVKFNPDFFEFVPSKGYITNAKKDKIYKCDEPRIRKEFAALHITKIKQLKKILRNAKVPKRFKRKRGELVSQLNKTIKNMSL